MSARRPSSTHGRGAPRGRRRGSRGGQGGVALLIAVTTIAIMSIVLLEFSATARTHLTSGLNQRDELRAATLADTALVMTRACLDSKAWGPMATMQAKMDLEQLCGMMLNIFMKQRLDLPIGGLSIEVEGIEGIGLTHGDPTIELQSEQSFIGLAGLHCAPPGGVAGVARGTVNVNCSSRKNTAGILMQEFCAENMAEHFEREQADGHKYTREEVIGNLVDWIDADDNRISYDPVSNTFVEGSGEGEDSYYRDVGDRDGYRSKDAPFDSIEELRLVRGINDALFDHLRDKVSVHASGKYDVNGISGDVLAALMRAESPTFKILEASAGACGRESETVKALDQVLAIYVKMILDARNLRSVSSGLSKPFRGATGVSGFIKIAADPIAQIEGLTQSTFGQIGDFVTREMILQRYGMNEAQYAEVQTHLGRLAAGLKDSLTTDSQLLRLRATGTVGNIQRQIFAVLKRDKGTVRTLYYREE